MLIALFGAFSRWFKKEMEYRQTMYDLQRLTNRDLEDLGINRGEIEFIARNAAEKKFA
jgi:uncharacterized protein YjiS (DUF1127 family)